MPVTAATLGLTADERRLLRRAGLAPGDLVHLSARDLVAATDEGIDSKRSARLVGLASMVAAGLHRSLAGRLMDDGVRDRADLATRSADELFLRLLDTTSRTSPLAHDQFAQAIYLASTEAPDPERVAFATWTRRRETSGVDPVLTYWRHRHGARTALPTPSRDQLRMPTLRVKARLFVGARDERDEPVTPLGQKDVVSHDIKTGRLLIGHWMWRGGHGPFMRLEDLRPGDGLQIGDDWFMVAEVEMLAAPVHLTAIEAPLVLATPGHLRVGIIGTVDMLRGVQRGRMHVVVRAEPAHQASVDALPRPVRRIPGAY